MTKEKTNKVVEKEVPIKQESLFYIHQLREHSMDLFGVKPEVLDGVLYNVKEIQLTKTEVQKRIDAFLKKGVKQ